MKKLKKQILSISICLFFVGTVSSTVNVEKYNMIELDETVSCSSPISEQTCTDPGDILFQYDVQTPTGDFLCQGVEYDGDYFYVTGSNSGFSPKKVHIFHSDGSYVASVDQSISYGSWKDIAYDGNHLYSSNGLRIYEWYITGLPESPILHEVGSFRGPLQPNRALAYDPVTDHFWTANYRSSIYEIGRDGINSPHIINTYENDLAIYGMAWDDSSPDGPWLWVYSQDGLPRVLISQFDPRSGNYTGVTYQGPYYDESQVAGGLSFYTYEGTDILVGLTQGGDLWDFIFGMDITLPVPKLEVGEINGGIGVKTEIKNTGQNVATNITYRIMFNGGFLIRPISGYVEGEIERISEGDQVLVSTGVVLGFWITNIIVIAEASGIDPVSKSVPAFILGPLVIILRSGHCFTDNNTLCKG